MNKTVKAVVLGIFAFCLIYSTASPAIAASAGSIDADAKATLEKFYLDTPAAKSLVKDAKGVLIFPGVFKAGIGIGGEYGEGALQIKGKTVDYYSTAAASLGFQLGAQKKSIVILFMDQHALDQFRNSSGWKAGVDASIAVVKVGADGSMDTSEVNKPILGFVFGQAGLMYNLSLEGAKFTKLQR